MNPKAYVKMLKDIEASTAAYTCPYCGATTHSISDTFFCSGCESLVQSAKALSQEETERASDIRALVKSENFTQAEQAYESISDYSSNPYFAYAEALTCIAESNYEESRISYKLGGFMEENTTHRKNSHAAFSKARLLFAKSIYAAKKSIGAGAETVNYLHAMFMSYVRLGDLKAADSVLKKTQKLDALVSEYESMVLDSSLGNYASAAKHAEKLLSKETAVVNAAYYLAHAGFKTNKPKDSLSLLEAFPGKADNDTVLALINEIKKAAVL